MLLCVGIDDLAFWRAFVPSCRTEVRYEGFMIFECTLLDDDGWFSSKIQADSFEHAARLFKLDVHGARKPPGRILVSDGKGTSHGYSWELEPLTLPNP